MKSSCEPDTCSSHENTDSNLPRESDDLLNSTTGVYTIYPDGVHPVQVYCNEYIHQISQSTSHKLSIYLEDFTGKFAYANYSVFDLGDEHRKYQLRINKFSGTSGLTDYLTSSHNTYMFTTKDQDNDNIDYNCAVRFGGNGGWWYSSCVSVNLNGPYKVAPVQNITAVSWYTYCGKICLSCNGVETVKECLDVEICRDDEYCLSGSSGSVFGKRRTGRHILCHTCCNSTNVCNMKSSCEPDTSSSHEVKGNENIHQISSSTSHKLSIYIEDFTGKFAYANYSVFDLGDEHRKYQLRVNEFSGTSGLTDYITGVHSTYMFSTKDQDNDIYAPYNCAVKHGGNGGWWYSNCINVNLNGPYMAGPVQNNTAMVWVGWPSTWYSLKKVYNDDKKIFEKTIIRK
ncbi:unnamed protein product [Mytilus edulis]|uniref:Fibrinogen C-terminal domain-containing protein n=1 Tax=Mytilus edulis TaxID=6550 RepID=A0A8S3QKE4_MYTED|nr:unnamed protein product [Mytilus edulis]